MIAHTRLGRDGASAMPMRPLSPFGRPALALRSVQVSPPSVDLKMAVPGPALRKPHG